MADKNNAADQAAAQAKAKSEAEAQVKAQADAAAAEKAKAEAEAKRAADDSQQANAAVAQAQAKAAAAKAAAAAAKVAQEADERKTVEQLQAEAARENLVRKQAIQRQREYADSVKAKALSAAPRVKNLSQQPLRFGAVTVQVGETKPVPGFKIENSVHQKWKELGVIDVLAPAGDSAE